MIHRIESILCDVVRAMTLLLVVLSATPGVNLKAQGISISNTYTVANAAAMLDISLASGPFNKGLLIPRVDFSQRTGNFTPLLQAAQGLMVYQTDVGTLGEGLYYNTSTSLTPNWVKAGATGWQMDGNTATSPATNFLGTTDANGIDFRTNNIIRMSVLSGGNVGIGGTNPAVKLAVGGNGANPYFADAWIENNIHVQGSEQVPAASGARGRLNLGSKSGWPNVGAYAELNSANTANDLVLGASSNQVRIGPGGVVVQRLVLAAGTEFQMVDGAALDKILASDALGNGSWTQLENIMPVYTASATRTTINYDWAVPGNFTDVAGLTITFYVAVPSYVVARTTGSLESTGAAGSWSATITALKLDGASLQEQGTDLINTGPGYIKNRWEIFQTLSNVAVGWHTIKVGCRSYYSSGASFYAGGTTLPGLTNSGDLLVRVIPK